MKRPAKPRPPPEPVWATAKQMWTRYQISRATWWRISKIAGFPKPLHLGRAVRWNVEAVDKYLMRKKTKSGIRK
ncbi:helix-turn-helix transcriptional regulator [Pseudomonas sp. D47]|uniref:helix-turn-helix transcriptional regulator n=1 Tax=Pseudomonas sp. D47 TaxID=3159447 RepID=UPI00387B02D3